MALIQYLLIRAFPEAVVHRGCGILFINNETFGSRTQNLTVQLWEFLCNSRCILPLTYILFWHQNQKPNVMRKIWRSKCRIHFCLQSMCHIKENQWDSEKPRNLKAISLSYLQERLIMKSFPSSSHHCPRSFLPANKTTEAATFLALWTQILLSKTTCYFITSEVRGWRGKDTLCYLMFSPHASVVLWMNYNLTIHPQKKNSKQHFSFHITLLWNCQREQKKISKPL